MRKAALLCVTGLFAALSCALAVSGGDAAPKPGIRDAMRRTLAAPSLHYVLRVQMRRHGTPLTLHVRGQRNRRTISVSLHVGAVKLPDGTRVPGPSGAALLDGPFLYERAPDNIVVQGTLRWLRLTTARLSAASADLQAVHAMTPSPLLRVIGEAHMWQAGTRLFRGTVAYDDPIVRTALARLTGNIEFRHLRLSAFVGRDGLLHRVLLTGRTADGKTTLQLAARFYLYGRPVHVSPPAPGTFMDTDLLQLQT